MVLFPPNDLPTAPPIDAQKALLFIDFQNDFVESDGKLPASNISSFIGKLPVLANSFRSKGSVIWIRTEFNQPRLAAAPETGFINILLKQNVDAFTEDAEYQVRRIYHYCTLPADSYYSLSSHLSNSTQKHSWTGAFQATTSDHVCRAQPVQPCRRFWLPQLTPKSIWILSNRTTLPSQNPLFFCN
jgi:hypothetical protein